MFYQANLKILAERFPDLAAELHHAPVETDLRLELNQSKTNLPVARLTRDGRSVYLNSFYNPEGEATNWAAGLVNETRSCLLLCGTGFFYHPAALRETRHFTKIVCYEPSLTILRTCLAQLDLRKILADPNVLLLAGADHRGNADRLAVFLRYLITDMRAETLPAYQTLFARETGGFQKEVTEALRTASITIATNNHFAEQWLVNSMHNLPAVLESPGVRHYFNAFAGVPAIVVGAGPSLEKNVRLLAELPEKALIIAAGSAVKPLVAYGIRPHFLVAFDGGEVNKSIYHGLDLRGVHLIFNHRFYYESVAEFAGPKIHMRMDIGDISDLIAAAGGGYEYGSILSGYSVSHSALDLAFKLGCNPITLIGQDLSFSNDKKYAGGRSVKQRLFTGDGKLRPGYFYETDIHGNPVPTHFGFKTMQLLFERHIAERYQGNAEIINATEAGLPIRGTVNRKLAEVVEQYCLKNHRLSETIREIYQKGMNELSNHKPVMNRIPALIFQLAAERADKMEELLDQGQRLRISIDDGEFDYLRLETVFEKIAAAYKETMDHRMLQILLNEFNTTKVAAQWIQIARLGPFKDREHLGRKAECLVNIIVETKKVLEFIVSTHRF